MGIWFVIIGGFLGAAGRYLAGEWVQVDSGFPAGTLCVNLIGCVVLGWFLTKAEHWSWIRPEWTLLVGTGIVGSFTTFSTFSLETIQLVQKGAAGLAVIYVIVTVSLGVLLAYAGRLLAYKRKEGENE